MKAELVKAFDVAVYRSANLDLRAAGHSDEALRSHFLEHGYKERRIFGPTGSAVEYLSMRWLRGQGVEIGAGNNPTRLFGDAAVVMADFDPDLSFGGSHFDLRVSIDDPDMPRIIGRQFDFAVASHVLEHSDSILRSLSNLANVVRSGGIVYVILPDIRQLDDANWMPNFDFAHHITEFTDPLDYAKLHDDLFFAQLGPDIGGGNAIADFMPEYRAAVNSGNIPQHWRFMHHKHNYTYGDWLELMVDARRFLNGAFEIEDARYGLDRHDCHFVLTVK